MQSMLGFRQGLASLAVPPSRVVNGVRHGLTRAASWIFGATAIGQGYRRAVEGDAGVPFFSRALRELRIAVEVDAPGGHRIPEKGPVVVVANHPFGAVDGLALLDVLTRARPDVRVLANHLLAAIPDLREHVLTVDAFGGAGAKRRNVAALREALARLRAGACLCVFPAGEVAHTQVGDRIVDSPWRETAGELALRGHAAVLPVFFEGHNSRVFRRAGRIHPLLRTALLPREMWARRGTTVRLRLGELLSAARLAEWPNPAARTAWLRTHVDALAARARAEAVAARGDAAAIEADVVALAGTALAESGPLAVYCARASELPHVLLEIGRLRELTFREVGEGTGRARDLDAFDQRYLHLFVWDRNRREVAGAYRLCPTDGASGPHATSLYTQTLFDYDHALLDRLGPALELGRSFVALDYQRDYSPLLLLWKGIGRFVARSPRYRHLFGAVSISDRYSTTTRELLVAFLNATRRDSALAPLVRARHPFAAREPIAAKTLAQGTTVDDLSSAVRRIEADGKDIPVLLRQYLRLNARLLAFSVDATFGDALDGLVVVDLTAVAPSLLGRYMGRSEVTAFRAFHQSANAQTTIAS
jgi:putative hemolysin